MAGNQICSSLTLYSMTAEVISTKCRWWEYHAHQGAYVTGSPWIHAGLAKYVGWEKKQLWREGPIVSYWCYLSDVSLCTRCGVDKPGEQNSSFWIRVDIFSVRASIIWPPCSCHKCKVLVPIGWISPRVVDEPTAMIAHLVSIKNDYWNERQGE